MESPVYEFLAQNKVKYKGLIRINATSGHIMSLLYWIICIIAFSAIGLNNFILYVFAVHHGFLAFLGLVYGMFFLASHKITGASDAICMFRPDKFSYIKSESKNSLIKLFLSIVATFAVVFASFFSF